MIPCKLGVLMIGAHDSIFRASFRPLLKRSHFYCAPNASSQQKNSACWCCMDTPVPWKTVLLLGVQGLIKPDLLPPGIGVCVSV